MKPRESKAYECDHMRPVVRIDGEWFHLWPEGHVFPENPSCQAGVYEVDCTLSGDHAIHEMWVDE